MSRIVILDDSDCDWLKSSTAVANRKRRIALQRATLEAKLQEACIAIRKHNESILQEQSGENLMEEKDVDVRVHIVSPEREADVQVLSAHDDESSGSSSSSSTSSTSSGNGSISSRYDSNDSIHDHVESCRTLHVVRQKFASKHGLYIYTGPVIAVNDQNAKLQLVPHGSTGEIWYACGQHYRGEVYHGQRHGHGENLWASLTKNGNLRTQMYRGMWKNDHREGFGTHAFGSSEGHRKIVGTWAKGRLHGRVSMSFEDGSHYDGSVVKGKRHGRGTQTFRDGKVYSGQYRNGTPEGYGTLKEHDLTYRGQFQSGKRHGYGIQAWPHKTYDGEWHLNVMHGRGKLLWNNGACYTGQFHRGKFHGNGCYRDAEGNKFVGNFSQGYKQGDGKEYDGRRGIYSGRFHKGRRQGYGRMMYADGSLYSGSWKRGQRWGRGILVRGNGIVEHCGHFERDEPVFKKQLETRDDLNIMSPTEDEENSKYSSRDLSMMTELTDFVDYLSVSRILI